MHLILTTLPISSVLAHFTYEELRVRWVKQIYHRRKVWYFPMGGPTYTKSNAQQCFYLSTSWKKKKKNNKDFLEIIVWPPYLKGNIYLHYLHTYIQPWLNNRHWIITSVWHCKLLCSRARSYPVRLLDSESLLSKFLYVRCGVLTP